MPTRPVAVIIGMMGAGKTRVGKEVAQLMSLPFADADVEIEHEVGMRIPNISSVTANPRSARSNPRSSPGCCTGSEASSPWAAALR